MHTTSTRVATSPLASLAVDPTLVWPLDDEPPARSGAPASLLRTSRMGVTTRRMGPMTRAEIPMRDVELLWEGAHPLLEVLALLSVVSVVPAAWFGLMALMG